MKRKIILVTGASRGLGRVMAEILETNGYTVYKGVRNIQEGGGKVVKLDITNEQDCRDAVKQIIEKEGRIDVLINNAGYTIAGPTTGFEIKDYQQILNTNTIGAFRLIKEVVGQMRKQKYGRIINITSLNGLVALPNFGLYSSSKFALEALGLSLRYELAKDNVWVTNFAPGAIASGAKEGAPLPHKPAREKFKILYFLMPMITQEKIAQKLIEIIENPRPPASVLMGNDAKITHLLQKILPGVVWDKLLLFVWNKK